MEDFPAKTNQTSFVLRIGSAGWNFPRESLPPGISGASHLHRYSQVFNCCEINTSFYRAHKNETWRRWAESVPAGFRFSVKAPRVITHELQLNCHAQALIEFLGQVQCLGEKLGPLLFQLPPSLEFDRKVARRFWEVLRKTFAGEVVCEPRHSSWFSQDANDLLVEFQVARAVADPARAPAARRPGGTLGLIYHRLHGSPRTYYSSYSDEFLNRLARDLLVQAVNASVWCIFDNTASGNAIRNALDLRTRVRPVA